MKRALTTTSLLLAVLLLTGGLAFAAGEKEADPAAAPVIRVGAAVSLTGDLARFGNMVRNGYELWKETVNAKGGIQVGNQRLPVEVIYYDDQSDNQTAARLTERLIVEDKVNFLLGPYGSGPTFATTAIAERYNVITVATLANAPRIYERGFKNVFSVLAPGPWIFRSFIDMLDTMQPKPQRLAIISPDDLFPAAVAEGAREYAQQKGYQVVYFEKYPKGVRDLSSTVLKIKDARADVLLGSGYLEEAILTMRQLNEQRVALKAIAFTTGPELEDFRNSLGPDAENVFGVSWWMPQMAYSDEVFGTASDYARAYAARFPEELAYQGAAGSQGGLLLQLAIEKAGSLDTDAVRQALSGMESSTFWGPTKWDQTGQNIAGSSVAFQIQRSAIQTVYPPAAATARPLYPHR